SEVATTRVVVTATATPTRATTTRPAAAGSTPARPTFTRPTPTRSTAAVRPAIPAVIVHDRRDVRGPTHIEPRNRSTQRESADGNARRERHDEGVGRGQLAVVAAGVFNAGGELQLCRMQRGGH